MDTPLQDENSWMESKPQELKDWLVQQNKKLQFYRGDSVLFKKYFDSIDGRLASMPAKSSLAITERGTYVNYRDAGARKFSILFVDHKAGKRNNISAQMRLEENESIAYFYPSPDDRYGILGITVDGSEVSELKILDMRSGKLLPDAIDRTQAQQITFGKSLDRFSYRRFDNIESPTLGDRMKGMTIRLHKIGSDSKSDPVLVGEGIAANPAFEHDDYFFYSELQQAGMAIATAYKGTIAPHRLYFKKLDEVLDPKRPWQQFVKEDEGITVYAFGKQSLFLLSSSSKENLNRIEEVSFDKGQPVRRVIYEEDGINFDNMVTSSEGLYLIAHKKLKSMLYYFPKGASKPLIMTQESGADLEGLMGSPHQSKVMMTKASVEGPASLLTYDSKEKFKTVELDAKARLGLTLEVREFEATSNDSTMIPYELVSRKGLTLGPETPILVRSYATFGNIYRPYYDRMMLDWYEKGGTVVYCYARGGGELGEGWHKAAMKETKHRSVDDTIACAEDLIRRGFTNPTKLAFMGTSAGGIIAGNLITRRPDLFAAVISQSAALELSKMQFATTIGSANIAEFGDMTKPEEAGYIRKLDPYLQIEKGKSYPAVLCVHGYSDSRLPIWMSAKFCKRLQEAQSGPAPVLMKAEFGQGHFAGADRVQRSERMAEILAFLTKELKVPENAR